MSAIEFEVFLARLRTPYLHRLTGTPTDSREFLALSDLYIRLVYLIVCGESSTGELGRIRVLAAPGIGSMLTVLANVKQWKMSEYKGWSTRAVWSVADKFDSLISTFQVGQPSKAFRHVRNRLSHGHPLPVDESAASEIVTQLRSLCERMHEGLIDVFKDTVFTFSGAGVTLRRTADTRQNHCINLGTLFCATKNAEGSRIGVYSHFESTDGGRVLYLVPGQEMAVTSSLDEVASFKHNFLRTKSEDRSVGRYARETVRDIGGFTEDYSTPGFSFGDDEQAGHIFVSWVRSTSDKNQPRDDAFRIDRNGQRLWRTREGEWRPYESFLREISNWKLLARRVRLGLEHFMRQRESEETSRIGPSKGAGVSIDAHLNEVDEDLTEGRRSELQLRTLIDSACDSHAQCTQVFFVIGQAGLGKTRLMLHEAAKRAALLEEDPDSTVPLFLFVSSTGRTLSSLEDAINSALNITKLLSADGARALCRNGLLVLFVDGFDELLGGSGYENALGSLEPWFQELGGRGVLVASARSSYYLSQYRRSLRQRTGIHVQHTLAQLEPWNPKSVEHFLTQAGVSVSVTSRLSPREWKILGVPFFAKAYAAWHDQKGHSDGNMSIFDIVVHQYLERESAKLEDPNQGRLMTPEELRDLFSGVAEVMQTQSCRELEFSDLAEWAAFVICEDSLEARPGLARRLTSLCGIDSIVQDEASTQFRFSHEIMFDCFLAVALQRAARQSTNHLLALLRNGKVHKVALDWLVQRESETIRTALNCINVQPGDQGYDALSENVGALWTSLVAHHDGAPPTEFARNLQLGVIKLSSRDWRNLGLRGCSVEELVMPESGDFRIDLTDVHIRRLRFTSEEVIRNSLLNVVARNIDEIWGPSGYADTPMGVRDELVLLGLVARSENSEGQDLREAAEFFLGRISAKIECQVIVDTQSRLSDDPRLNWTKKLGNSKWQDFLHHLGRSGVTTWAPTGSGGRPKIHLDFQVPVTTVLKKDFSRKEVARFWHELGVEPGAGK